MRIIVQADMQCVADFIGNSFVVQRRSFASCLKQIKSYASRHRKAFRRKHFSTTIITNIIHHHYHHKNNDSIIRNRTSSLDNFDLIHSTNNSHSVRLLCILFISFIASIIKQLILHLRFTSRDYFRNSQLLVS